MGFPFLEQHVRAAAEAAAAALLACERRVPRRADAVAQRKPWCVVRPRRGRATRELAHSRRRRAGWGNSVLLAAQSKDCCRLARSRLHAARMTAAAAAARSLAAQHAAAKACFLMHTRNISQAVQGDQNKGMHRDVSSRFASKVQRS